MLKVIATELELKYDKFAKFLYSEVEEEPSGMIVTVLSLMSQLSCDPWVEAETLSQLSKIAAVSRLAHMIFSTCASRRTLPEAERLAARLIDRLPKTFEAPITNSDVNSGHERFMTLLAIVFAIAWLLLFFSDRRPI